MNIEEILKNSEVECISIFEKQTISRLLKKDSKEVQYVKDMIHQSGKIDWEECQTFAKNVETSLCGVCSSGGVVTHVTLRKKEYDSKRYVIQYKGIIYSIDTTREGEMFDISVRNGFKHTDGCNYKTILKGDEPEEDFALNVFYEKTIKMLKEDKQKEMNYYNAELRRIKKEYRESMDSYKEILKEAKNA